MKVIYNPVDGAPITSFIFQGILVDPHYPDGYELSDGKFSNGLMQYHDALAASILETYEFLTGLNADQVKAILERPAAAEFKCDFPGCEFSSRARIGMEGHKRKHAKEASPTDDSTGSIEGIPVAGGKRLLTLAEKKQIDNNGEGSLPNGRDADGVSWYGEGVQVENHSASSFAGIRSPGQGHFRG